MNPIFLQCIAMMFCFLSGAPNAAPAQQPPAQTSSSTVQALLQTASSIADESPARSLLLADSAIGLAQKQSDLKGEAEAWRVQSSALRLLGENDRAIRSIQQAIRLHEQSGDRGAVARSLNEMANLYRLVGDYQHAIALLLRANDIFETEGDQLGCAAVASDLGVVSRNMGDTAKAVLYHLKALASFQKLHDLAGTVKALERLGTIELVAGNVEAALARYQHAYKIADSLHLAPDIRSGLLNNIGNCQRAAGHFQEAALFYNNSLEISRAIGDRNMIAVTLKNTSLNEKASGNLPKALTMMLQSLDMARSVRLRRFIRDDLEHLADIYTAMGRPRDALEAFKQYVALKDSLINEDVSRHTAELEVRYATEKNQRTIQELTVARQRIYVLVVVVIIVAVLGVMLLLLLRTREKVKATEALVEQQEKLRQNQEWHAAILEATRDGILVEKDESIVYANATTAQLFGYDFPAELIGKSIRLIQSAQDGEKMRTYGKKRGIDSDIPVLYEFLGRKKDGSVVELETAVSVFHMGGDRFIISSVHDISLRKKADEAVRESLREKEILLKEIHHRVKNNLQVISSMLRLQAEEIPSEEMKRLFLESQNRVRSMALVHEKLYQSHSLAAIDFAEYVQGLAVQLFRSYHKNGIGFVLSIEGIYFSVDTAIPCGLIVNELLSNALKHAFPNDGTGTITVTVTKDASGLTMLQVKDDGIGVREKFDIHSMNSLGMQLVLSLTQQLDGRLHIENNPGACFTITFRPEEPAS
ncbi:MAG: tetratricopeptide repeat protein [Ignavibacteriales bacterium]|nr:tetratricopeptide repeat protein [Ignavibacteriales bacterium]